MKYTEKQKKAVENKGNILVSAAAGSGKTRVLTDRICRIFQRGEADVDDLLVLTFTDAAAAEMKKRIYDKLMSVSSDSEKMGVLAERVARANISTIHSFCQRVIRDKYYVLGLSPSFNIASEKDNTRLLKKTLAEILEEHNLAEDADLKRLYLKYGKRNGQALTDMIISIYQTLMVMPEPKDYQKHVAAGYKSEVLKKTVLLELHKDGLKKLSYAREILNNLTLLASETGYTNVMQLLLGYTENLDKAILLFNDKKYTEAEAVVVFDANLATKEIASDEIKSIFKRGREEAKKQIDSVMDDFIFSSDIHTLSDETPAVSADTRALLGLALSLRHRFSEAKLKKNTLDFSDLEHYAYEILKDPQQAGDYNFKYIFIDEYQDTNPLQDAIIEKIKGLHNLFMVGDVKQSIYGFRHADSDIFLKKQDQFSEFTDKPFDEDELIRMNENFRSSLPVVSAVNFLMGELLTPEFGNIDYKNAEALVHASKLTDGTAELMLIDSNADFYPPEFNGDALSAAEAEAFAVANQINKIKGESFFSRQANEEKALDFGDMVVLLRALKTSGPVYKRVFESCGIPVDMSLASSDATLPEIEVFTHILKCVLNPTDDIALISALKYSFFEINSDDIAAIRIAANGKKQSFYRCVKDYIDCHDDALSRRLVNFFGTLEHLKDKSITLSGEAFLSYVHHHLQFDEILAASPRKSLKAEALKGYIRALLAEAPGSAHLARMVYMLDEMKQHKDTLDANAALKNPNSVRIMTIHKSKGLEFPVVFVAGLEKSFHKENKSDFILDKSLGLGFKILDPQKNYKSDGLIFQSLLKKQQREALYEEIRVLYVAMTRAENCLYLVGGIRNLKSGLDRWLTYDKNAQAFASNYIDLIAPALLNKKGFAEGFSIDRFLPPELSRTPSLPVSIIPKRGYAYAGGADRQAILNGFIAQKPKPVDVGYAYPHANTLGIPSKRSVSSLKPKAETPLPRKQAAFTALDASSLTAVERGTAFHVYMQHVDYFLGSESEIKQHIDALVREAVLTPDEASALSPESILSVLQSDIIARAKKSPMLFREKNFSLKMDSGTLNLPAGEMVVVQGTIDLCFLEGNAFVLVDYKTDRVTKDTLPARKNAYLPQLETYAKALTDLTGYQVKEKYLYFLNFDCILV